MNSTHKTRGIGILFVCIGLVGLFFCILGLAVYLYINDSVQARPESATGTIISCRTETRVVTSSPAETTTSCVPTIRFITKSGEKIEFVAKDASAGFHKSDRVQIRYNAANSKEAIIPSAMWNYALIFFCIGAFVAVLGVIGFLRRNKPTI